MDASGGTILRLRGEKREAQKKLKAALSKLDEARELLKQAAPWMGVDPTSKEALEIDAVDLKIKKFLKDVTWLA